MNEETEKIPPNDIEILSEIDIKLEKILELFDIVSSAASTILTYGVFYIPLAIIVFALWTFFHPFIQRYR